MADTTLKTYNFTQTEIETLGLESKEVNWPVVYQIYDNTNLYIGETTNLKNRMSQHYKNDEKTVLGKFSVIYNSKFNKSVALDLESQLIRWFSGEGRYKMLNKNDGIADREYYDRKDYQKQFSDIWERLRKMGLADKPIQEIENSGLFKFSPYKRLSENQMDVVNEVLLDLDEAFKYSRDTISIVGGSEGTGKTIVLMYLIKFIRDIAEYIPSSGDEVAENELELFFKEPFRSRLDNKTIAMVVPNQSLKGSIKKIFKGISNLCESVDVLSPMEFGSNGITYDITFVDEAHLLKASNQEVHKTNRARVDNINSSLFNDNNSHTELDWIIKKSKNVVMVFGDQRVRPNNITTNDIRKYNVREHTLKLQMRSKGGNSYIDYLSNILSPIPPALKQQFKNFEFKLYEDFTTFVTAIKAKEDSVGLSRIVAGYAWEWKSRKNKNQFDIEIDGISLRWNSVPYDWIGSPKSTEEVGSIYTIQGFDLNYCGVIVGNDIGYDPVTKQIIFNRQCYYDRGAKKRNKQQLESNTILTDDDLLDQVLRTYRILMNRSIKGTYVYVCDINLRKYLAQFIEIAE